MWIVFLLMLAYGVLHTALAGWVKPRFRARFGDRAYHGLYRILFNVIVTITLLPVALALASEPTDAPVVWRLPDSFTLPLLVVRLVGLIGAAASLLQIDGMRFLGITQLRAYINGGPLPLPDEPLQTGGLYGFVRHPLYLFSLLTLWPVPVMGGAYFGFCVGATLYFAIGSLYEERRLVTAFGADYKDYQRRVAWLVPFPRFR